MNDPAAPSPRVAWMDALLSTPADGGLDAYARAVAFVLYRHMTPAGQARPGTRTLAREAAVSHTVAEGRVRRLEEAGWLSVTRTPGAVNRYRATIPTALPHGAVDRATPWRGPVEAEPETAPPDGAPENATAPSQTKTAPPRSHEPVEPVIPTSSARSPHPEPESNAGEGKGRVTPKRILTEMARRKLALAREQGATWAPPEGCDRRREAGWLNKEFTALREQHGFELDDLIAKLHPDLPQPTKPWRNDPDYYVWKLDRDLAGRDWLQPTAEETRAKLARERAEREAALAATDPAEIEAGRQAALELRDRLIADRERRHLRAVPA